MRVGARANRQAAVATADQLTHLGVWLAAVLESQIEQHDLGAGAVVGERRHVGDEADERNGGVGGQPVGERLTQQSVRRRRRLTGSCGPAQFDAGAALGMAAGQHAASSFLDGGATWAKVITVGACGHLVSAMSQQRLHENRPPRAVAQQSC